MMKYLIFMFESPVNFIGCLLLFAVAFAFVRVLAVMLIGIAEGIGKFRLVETTHLHVGDNGEKIGQVLDVPDEGTDGDE